MVSDLHIELVNDSREPLSPGRGEPKQAPGLQAQREFQTKRGLKGDNDSGPGIPGDYVNMLHIVLFLSTRALGEKCPVNPPVFGASW